MDPIWERCDDLGPQRVTLVHNQAAGLRAVVVVDNTARGPSIGGCRMAPDVSIEECARLARAMTFKNAAAGLRHGGGKSVIFADPSMVPDAKERLLRAFAQAIGDIRDYIVGPDMGTDETCMAWCHDEIGRAVGLPPALGGIPLDEIGATGFGVAIAAEVATERAGIALEGARVVMQGFGAVGRHGARFLANRGAVLIAASDSRGAIRNRTGLDVEALIAHKLAGEPIATFPAGEPVAPDTLVTEQCEIWVPAARPDVITGDNAASVAARLVVSGANIAVTEAGERVLTERGVVVVPDFIANAGGVIAAATEYAGGTEAAAFTRIESEIRRNTKEVLHEAQTRSIPPSEAAIGMARRRIEAAMTLRRFG